MITAIEARAMKAEYERASKYIAAVDREIAAHAKKGWPVEVLRVVLDVGYDTGRWLAAHYALGGWAAAFEDATRDRLCAEQEGVLCLGFPK